MKRGQSRPTPSYQDVLNAETRPVPAALRKNAEADFAPQPIPASRYTSADFFKLEVEHVFLKTWQFACRVEDIPNAGDTHVFEIVGKSALIVRQDDGSIHAYVNACRHRGRKLLGEGRCLKSIYCPYHGLSWKIDGSLLTNPFQWDVPETSRGQLDLLKIAVSEWAGFVFVNFDKDARPLLSILEPLLEDFQYWRMQDCYKAAHVAKIAPANWKASAEAFLEMQHITTTHPQSSTYLACDASQYDIYSDHISRALLATGVSGDLAGKGMTEEAKIATMLRVGSRAGNQSLGTTPDAGATARSYSADLARKLLSSSTGEDFSNVCDADVIDGIAYDVFPNFHIWGGFSQKICYRFRPVGLDHEQTLIEVMLYKLKPADGPAPQSAECRMLGDDDPWALATELNYLAGIYDQDHENLGPVQQGLRALGEQPIQLTAYQDSRITNLHRTVDTYIAAGSARA